MWNSIKFIDFRYSGMEYLIPQSSLPWRGPKGFWRVDAESVAENGGTGCPPPCPDQRLTHLHIFQMKYWQFGLAVNTFAHFSNEILTVWISCDHICIFFQWNIDSLDQLLTHLHIFQIKYSQFGSAVNTFAHISNEIFTVWISCEHIYTFFPWNIHILDQLWTHLHIVPMKY